MSRRLIGPVLTLLAATALLLVARWIWAHHSVPAYNPDSTPQRAAEVLSLAIAVPAIIGGALAILAIYLRLRKPQG